MPNKADFSKLFSRGIKPQLLEENWLQNSKVVNWSVWDLTVKPVMESQNALWQNIFEELIHFAWGFTLKYRWGENHLLFSTFFPPNTFTVSSASSLNITGTQVLAPTFSSLGVTSGTGAAVSRCVWRYVSVRISTYPAREGRNFVFEDCFLLYSPLKHSD